MLTPVSNSMSQYSSISSQTPQLQKTVKILAIIQITILAISVIGALAFIIAAAAASLPVLLVGSGVCIAVALAILGRNLCCRSMMKHQNRVYVPIEKTSFSEKAFHNGFHARTPLKQVWRQGRGQDGPRQLPGSR